MLENSLFKTALQSENSPSEFQGRALHAVGWSDLTARINAARDLRELLKHDLVLGAASFSDAAAGYFVPQENGKPDVNHNALGASKGLEDIRLDHENTEPSASPEGSDKQGCREQ